MTVTVQPFGALPDGSPVELYTLRNRHGLEVNASTYGGIITTIATPDRHGRSASVVLGHADLEPYLENRAFLGAVIGRYANRIANGRFELDGRTFQLTLNDGAHHLHGGERGFDRHLWAGVPRRSPTAVGVALSRQSGDGEEGYPGVLRARVIYDLTDTNELWIRYEATASKPTVVNLTQHTYFDLSAGEEPDVLGHELILDADTFLPVDDGLIPLGAAAAVADTPFDFRHRTTIGARIHEGDEQLRRGRGYDHNWIIKGAGHLRRAAMVVEPRSGRTLEVWSTEPGVQFYSGNRLTSAVTAHGRPLSPHAGFCLETQHFPDSPNHPTFPTTVLRPSYTCASTTMWRFGSC